MKNKNRRFSNTAKRFIAAALTALMVLTLAVPSGSLAYAEDTGSVTLTYPAPDVEFSLYYIGTNDQQGEYNLNDPYASYSVDLTGNNAATTLADYIQLDSIAADQTASSEQAEDGSFSVSFTNLKEGVYLILGTTAEYDGYTYYSSPVMLELPYWNNDNALTWDRTVEGKYEKKPDSDVPGDKTLSVRKVWKSDDEDERPESVTVQLMCDGALSDRKDAEVVLDEDNNWSYQWEDLNEKCTWTVVEKDVPEGYTVSKSTDGDEIVLTNTGTTPSDETPPAKHLPRTGQYWLPVLGLVTAGLFLILLGLLRRIRKSE